MRTTIEYEKGFGAILEATAGLIIEAFNGTKYSQTASAAVLQSTLLLEAAANCCINDLKLGGKLSDELDRLPSLTKLDLFLLIRSGGKTTIDRGAALYQDVKELKTIRDKCVHPKTSRVTWIEVKDGSEVGEHEKSTRHGIALRPFSWSVDDALRAFKAVNNFLQYYFLTLCAMEPRTVRLLLLAPFGNEEIEDIFLATQDLEDLQKRYEVNLAYVGVGAEAEE